MQTAKILFIAATALSVGISNAYATEKFGFGKSATQEEIAGWNIDVLTDGTNLPSGSGTVARGREIFAEKCAACHEEKGKGGIGGKLSGGEGTLNTAKSAKTVGSYWPYATTLFDYIRRAMPLTAPQSLSSDDVYSLSAYILNLNKIVPDDAKLDAKTLAAIKMPNRDNFFVDRRPDTQNTSCMKDCIYKKPTP